MQIFHPSWNTLSRLSIFGAAFFAVGVLMLTYFLIRSPYQTMQDVVREQPVQFSHEHHVSGLGIDCRYCHTTVEYASSAGMPPTYTCMSCHSQIWPDSPLLEPVRMSLANDKPLQWNRVHDLPDYAYFHHGIHIQKGIGCAECHGRVDKMPLAWKDQPLTMEWCLDCHRHPENHIRPKEKVFQMDWSAEKDEKDEDDKGKPFNQQRPANQQKLGRMLVEKYKVPVGRLDNCSVCHR